MTAAEIARARLAPDRETRERPEAHEDARRRDVPATRRLGRGIGVGRRPDGCDAASMAYPSNIAEPQLASHSSEAKAMLAGR